MMEIRIIKLQSQLHWWLTELVSKVMHFTVSCQIFSRSWGPVVNYMTDVKTASTVTAVTGVKSGDKKKITLLLGRLAR